MARSKRAAAVAAEAAAPAAEQEAPKLPPTRFGVVVGYTPDGRLYHQTMGEGGMLELEGLMAYMRQILDRRWDIILPIPGEDAVAAVPTEKAKTKKA